MNENLYSAGYVEGLRREIRQLKRTVAILTQANESLSVQLRTGANQTITPELPDGNSTGTQPPDVGPERVDLLPGR